MDTDQIDLVQQYKYLGILLDEHLKLESYDDLFAKSGGRALSALISKYNVNKHLIMILILTCSKIAFPLLCCMGVKFAAITN